jgi:GH15 family glucan-1,4-alpha-glucosidase
MAYLPIENHGVIGNLKTVALVGINGSIDWFCFPHFDSPSVFASLLDDKRGGCYQICPAADDGFATKQVYWPETNVLVTRFLSDEGVGELIDFMPLGPYQRERGWHAIVRQVRVVRGRMTFRLRCAPAFNYARADHKVEFVPGGVRFATEGLALGLSSDHELRIEGRGVTAEFTLSQDESASFELHETNGFGEEVGFSDEDCERLFNETVEYWHHWLSRCTYAGRWREMVHRSALVLKLLVFEPTGAIVAAPTTSLPESLGGERNWDYRYTWMRDAAFTVYALIRIGFTAEAAAFMQWLDDRCHEMGPDGRLNIMYGIDGHHNLDEEHLDHLEGYMGSAPVRVGNGAYDQLQLDIYGELMDSVYLFNKYGTPISYDMWRHLRLLADYVCDHWDSPDEGIWEVRSGRQNFVYSRVMCWVALDRMLRLADKRSFPADRQRWTAVRDAIYTDIQERGWHQERNTFIAFYGSDSLDASALMMPLVLFMSPTDPRVVRTVDAILKPPAERGLTSAGLVHRYNVEEVPDGVRGPEGTFNMCTFWLVEVLTRMSRSDPARLNQARLLFEKMLSFANHLGLYSEQIGPRGEALGNFPQAFTHLGLISAAYNLDRALSGHD